MATNKQLTANRLNATHSTGPRTLEGKAMSSQNAARHQLSAKGLIILPGQENDFLQIEADLRSSVVPATPLQEIIFARALQSAWNLHRCRLAESELQATSPRPDRDCLTQPAFAGFATNLERYARSAENGLYKALRELAKLQTEQHYRQNIEPNTSAAISEPHETPAEPEKPCAPKPAIRTATTLGALQPISGPLSELCNLRLLTRKSLPKAA